MFSPAVIINISLLIQYSEVTGCVQAETSTVEVIYIYRRFLKLKIKTTVRPDHLKVQYVKSERPVFSIQSF